MTSMHKKILVVDDEIGIRQSLKKILEKEGYTVITASNGEEAFKTIRGGDIDLLITDIRMPEMDGLESMARVLREHKSVPLILNTAYSCYQDNFLTWAAEGYIIKSADLQPLKEKIREVLGCEAAV